MYDWASKLEDNITKGPLSHTVDSQFYLYFVWTWRLWNWRLDFSLVAQDEAVEEQTATHLPGDTVENLSSSNWKDRLAAMEKFTEVHVN